MTKLKVEHVPDVDLGAAATETTAKAVAIASAIIPAITSGALQHVWSLINGL
jgi:hypothetical protein